MLRQTRKTFTRAWREAVVIASLLSGFPYLQPMAIAAGATPVPAKGMRVAPAGATAVPLANAAAPVDFPAIVDRYGPAVVNISATMPEQQTSRPVPEAVDLDDPLAQFFKRSAPQFQEPQGGLPRVIKVIGSGFIVSPDGLILTNANLVGRAEEVTVKLTDQREFKAKVMAVDAQSDVAVIRIDARKLPTVKLGDSSRVRAGEPVLTIGAPYGFENTVTAGIVSAAPRTLPEGTAVPFIQTDVAANPDNSGGPLFNRSGEVIGINVQIYAQAGQYHSLTFAIPINVAAKVQAQLLAQDKASRGNLGVSVQDVDPGFAGAFGLPRAAGALVNFVEPGTSAAASGLKPGDVITQISDKAIDRSAELFEHAAGLKPGAKATLTLIRNRKPMTVTVTVGTVGTFKEESGTRQDEGNTARRLGLTVHPLNEAERLSSGLTEGLVVDEVYGPSAGTGIQPGDILLSFNGTPLSSLEQLSAMTAKAGRQVALLVQHDNTRAFVWVELR